MQDIGDFLWVEKYRPKTVDECILPAKLKETFQKIVEKQEIPNLLLYGPPGCGKTSVAYALCNQLGRTYLKINGSKDSGIDVLRTKIQNFCSTRDISGKKKIVILDEADYLNPNSTQPALRAFIEEFYELCRFIFTANYPEKIIEPLHSRTTTVHFHFRGKERKETARAFLTSVFSILKGEGVDYDKKAVTGLVVKHYPDFRRTINELQRYSQYGMIDEGVLDFGSSDYGKELLEAIGKTDIDFKKLEQWVANTENLESSRVYRILYDSLRSRVKDAASLYELVTILGRHQMFHAQAADKYLHVLSCASEIFFKCDFEV